MPTRTVSEMIQRAFQGRFLGTPNVLLGDASYYLPTDAEMQQLLQASQLDRRTWVAERFDCDDFAYALKGEASLHAYQDATLTCGLCVGMIWGDFMWVSGYHAVNWYISSSGGIYLVEPQTDQLYVHTNCTGRISLVIA